MLSAQLLDEAAHISYNIQLSRASSFQYHIEPPSHVLSVGGSWGWGFDNECSWGDVDCGGPTLTVSMGVSLELLYPFPREEVHPGPLMFMLGHFFLG